MKKTRKEIAEQKRWNNASPAAARRRMRPSEAKRDPLAVTIKELARAADAQGMSMRISMPPKSDIVNHPPHYVVGGIEAITVIEAWGLNFRIGNALKYLARAGRKNPEKHIEDLRKSIWYIAREIAALTKASK